MSRLGFMCLPLWKQGIKASVMSRPGTKLSCFVPRLKVMTHRFSVTSIRKYLSNMEDSRRTLQESFPVQAFKQQQSHAGWGLFPPQCYSTSTG